MLQDFSSAPAEQRRREQRKTPALRCRTELQQADKHLDSSEYSFSVAFRAYETLYDVRFYVANLAMDDLYSREVFYLERLSADRPLVAELALPMDLSAYTICFISFTRTLPS